MTAEQNQYPGNGVNGEAFAFPMSFAQQRLWLLHRLKPDSPAYNIPAAYRLRGHVNVPALESSFREIIRRHEILRTKFKILDGKPVQVVRPAYDFTLPIIDLRSSHSSDPLCWCREEAQRCFDLSTGALVRAYLLRCASEDHILFLNFHHIVFDDWSTPLIFRELSALYKGFSKSETLLIPDLPIQYADFALWQRNWLQGMVLQKQVSYWRQQLSELSVLQLPTDRPRPPVQSYRGAKQSILLPKLLANQLQAQSRNQGVTLFMTLLAAFQTLLYRYTGQIDIALGSPIAGRTRTETESLIGFFVNTLLLRTDLSGNPSFRELLSRVRKVALAAYEHQDFPFEKLVEELHPDRDLSRNPLFQVMFAHHNVPEHPFDLPGLSVSSLEIHTDTTKFDLSLDTSETTEGLKATFEYSTDLFDDASITRMMGHFKTLLEGIVATPNQSLAELPMLSEAEEHQLLIEWNNTETDYPKNKCIHELFEAQVEKTPDAVAVIFKNQQFNYLDLNTRANQLARYLRKLGVGPETLVAICIERSVEMLVGLLAILKAGGAYVPMSPEDPKARREFMLHDTQTRVLLTKQAISQALAGYGGLTICLDQDWPKIVGESGTNLNNEANPHNLAYVIYTSGSTGTPKGVKVLHRGVSRLLFGVNYAMLGAGATFAHLAPISFDASTFEIWGALLHGAKCVLYPERVPSPKDLGDFLRKYDVSTLLLVPSLFNQVMDEAPEALSCVRQLLIGAEALSVPHVLRALDLLPQTHIVNAYGPTEGTTIACCYPVPRQLRKPLHSIPIGRPIGNTKVYILDSHLRPVPVGVAGELHIAGDGLARGYLNQPDLSAEQFIADPFSAEPGARLYKTGDRARWLSDGNIEFLGRFDHQIKLRGYRIELGEIEAVLVKHATVRDAVVVAREANLAEKRLIAYVVTEPKSNITATELRAFLQQQLPEYMIPSRFITLDVIPLTTNGKVDRQLLPVSDHEVFELNETFVAPRTPDERKLADIWSDVLTIARIGIYDNFFELGGHSLLATQLVARVHKVFGVELPLRDFFGAPTIAGTAAAILQKQIRWADRKELDDLLADVEALPIEEARRLIKEK